MIRFLAPVLAILALTGCRSEESNGASAPKTQDAVRSSSAVEASGSTGNKVAAPPAAEQVSSNSLESNVQPPEPVFRPAPDWSQFPTGHIPGPGGVYSARVDVSGNVIGVTVVRPGHPRVDELVLEALRTWRFKPAMSDGRPIEATYHLTININLK
jgi:protein TonB